MADKPESIGRGELESIREDYREQLRMQTKRVYRAVYPKDSLRQCAVLLGIAADYCDEVESMIRQIQSDQAELSILLGRCAELSTLLDKLRSVKTRKQLNNLQFVARCFGKRIENAENRTNGR